MEIATKLGCKTDEEDDVIVKCLQNVESDLFYDSALEVTHPVFGRVMDDNLSNQPFFAMEPLESFKSGNFAEVPLIVGFTKDEGIYFIPPFVLDPTELQNLNDNWEVFGPKNIFGKCCEFSEAEIEKANLIREFYFGSEEISMANIQSLIDMFSDSKFWVAAHDVTTIVSSHLRSPVYEYMFTHNGSFSFSEFLGLPSSQYGVCHADDLHYLFNPHLVEFPALIDADFKVRDIMVQLWTSFVRDGKPSFFDKDSSFEWIAFDNINPSFLSINESPVNDYSEDFRNRIEFWNTLFPV